MAAQRLGLTWREFRKLPVAERARWCCLIECEENLDTLKAWEKAGQAGKTL